MLLHHQKLVIFNKIQFICFKKYIEQGLSTRSLIVAMPFGGVLEISRRFVDARRPLEMNLDFREEMIVPYMPELPITTEDLINYNQTIQNVHGIKTL